MQDLQIVLHTTPMISDLQIQLTIAAVASLTAGYVYYTRRLKKDVEDPSSPIASRAEKGSLLNTANGREPGGKL